MTKKKDKRTATEEKISSETEVTEETPKEETPATVDNQIALLETEIKELNERFLRNQAELQNFKRRINDERIKDRTYANLELIKKLLTPLDNFEIGLDKEKENGTLKPQAKGFEMIHRDLFQALTEEGLKPIEHNGEPFDPKIHQAVMTEKREGVNSGIVLEVFQKGYMFKDRVIRPAMVKVSE